MINSTTKNMPIFIIRLHGAKTFSWSISMWQRCGLESCDLDSSHKFDDFRLDFTKSKHKLDLDLDTNDSCLHSYLSLLTWQYLIPSPKPGDEKVCYFKSVPRISLRPLISWTLQLLSRHLNPQIHLVWTNLTASNQVAGKNREKLHYVTERQLENMIPKIILFAYKNYVVVNKKWIALCKTVED